LWSHGSCSFLSLGISGVLSGILCLRAACILLLFKCFFILLHLGFDNFRPFDAACRITIVWPHMLEVIVYSRSRPVCRILRLAWWFGCMVLCRPLFSACAVILVVLFHGWSQFDRCGQLFILPLSFRVSPQVWCLLNLCRSCSGLSLIKATTVAIWVRI
jgi:hypothetical protein